MLFCYANDDTQRRTPWFLDGNLAGYVSLQVSNRVRVSSSSLPWFTHMLDFAWLCLVGFLSNKPTQTAFTCSKLTMETLEQGVKYVQS